MGGSDHGTAQRQERSGLTAETEREVVPREVKRGQTTQGLSQTVLTFLVFIPRAMGRS